MSAAIDISVVILSWNDKGYLEECLESLVNSTKRTMEIIVVDNASTDGSPEMVEAKFSHVRMIRNGENLGFPKGNNVGMHASRGKYMFLLNSDIKILPGCMDAMADFMDKNPDVGMLGPRILNRDMTHQSSCRRFPSLWNNFCVMTGLATAFKNSKLLSGEHMFYFKGDRQIDVEVLVGCFWVVRRKASDKFGLLDEGFFMFAEDVDWCKRCKESGWRLTFFPGGEAIHYRGGSSAKKDPVWLAITQQSSILRYWKKHHTVFGVLGINCLMFGHKILRGGAAMLNYLVRPSKRQDSLVRMQVAGASLRALFSRSAGESKV